MSNERVDLAAMISGVSLESQLADADAILAAGYRKPRTVTTVEEVRLLSSDTVLLSDEGGVFQLDFGLWKEVGSRDSMAADDISLPATVLHVGGAL